MPFDYANLNVEHVDWYDIATALSKINRYLGHTQIPINVASHCLIGTEFLDDDELKLYFLLHDAHEAYTGDMPTPMKNFIPEFKERIEDPIQRLILEKAGLSPVIPPEIKEVDNRLLLTEMRQYHSGVDDFGWSKYEPYDYNMYPWSHEVAERMYLEALNEYLPL